MSKLKVPVSSRDHIWGPDDAPITLVEYGDYECPYCGAAHPRLKMIQAELGDKLRFVFRNFPLTQVHPFALLSAIAAEAAGLQGKFWEMHDYIFEHQALLSPQGLIMFAEVLEVDVAAFENDLKHNKNLRARVEEDFIGGVRSGVSGTPGFFVNGERYVGPLEAIALNEAAAAA